MKKFAPAIILTFFALLVLAAAPAFAESKRPASVVKAEKYLRELSTAKARFLQTAQDGTQLIGTFYLDRPGRLRFEYDPPIGDFVVADGFFIYFYDAELGEQTNAPIGQTLADFLLRTDLKLDGDVEVTDIKSNGGLLQLTLVQKADPGAGSLTLGFNEEPFMLKKWRVNDPAGLVTEIELFNMAADIQLPSELFVYANPKDREKRYND